MDIKKTMRLTALFDFYGVLLTEKQKNYIELYYEDDLSLGEIAEQYDVSRQAIYDNIRRTEKMLEEYEQKLGLVEKYTKRKQLLQDIQAKLSSATGNDEIKQMIQQLETIE